MVVNYTKTYPEDPRGPDEIRPAPPRWPNTFLMPFPLSASGDGQAGRGSAALQA